MLRTPFELFPDDISWRGPFDPAGDALWQDAMAGRITEREYWHRRSAEVYPDAEDPTYALMHDLYDTDEDRLVRPEVLRVLDRLLDAGRRVAVLTNDLRAFHGDAWVERITVLPRFEEVIDLSNIGMLKPAAEAFDHALKVLDVDAGDVVFIDDQPGNVEGAEAVGIRSVWFDPTDVAASVARITEAVAEDSEIPPHP